jgi:CheY-like chemotaxis protein
MTPRERTCTFYTRDLLFSSRVCAAAADCGLRVSLATDSGQLAAHVSAGQGDLVLIDLAERDLELEAVVDQLRRLPRPPEAIVAFGPHVQASLLQRARDIGCDEVLTRGEFNKRMSAVLSRYAGKSSSV